MCKFIRTKNKIISTKNLVNLETEDVRFKNQNIYRDEYGCLYEALKQADTIDELCDGFYIDIPGRAFNPLWVYKDFASCQKAATLLEENHVKGLIKTEKGLIFVWNFSKNEVINNG